LARYLIHGVLHLRGFDDRTPRARLTMKREEDRLLRELSRRFGRPETIVKRRAVKARRSAERVKRS